MSGSVSQRYKDALQAGHVAVVKGRPHDAIGHYQEAAGLVSDRPLPYVRMGEIHLRLEEPRLAVRDFDAALERAPSDLTAIEGKAAALSAMGQPQAAAELRAHATRLVAGSERPDLRQRPADPRLQELERHIANGAAARRAGDFGVASAAYLAAANGYLGIGDHVAAIDACLRGLEARPGNIDIHFTLAVLYLRRGWVDLGVQRVLLIERRLGIDDDPVRRHALGALARDFRSQAPQLERLAASVA